jgi:hypothetical protein
MMASQHKYKDVQAQDHDHHDDDSSTEVESLVGIEKRWAEESFEHRTRAPKRNICITILKASRWFVVILLQLIIIGLLGRDQGMLDKWWLRARSTSESEVGGDMTGWGPHSK